MALGAWLWPMVNAAAGTTPMPCRAAAATKVSARHGRPAATSSGRSADRSARRNRRGAGPRSPAVRPLPAAWPRPASSRCRPAASRLRSSLSHRGRVLGVLMARTDAHITVVEGVDALHGGGERLDRRQARHRPRHARPPHGPRSRQGAAGAVRGVDDEVDLAAGRRCGVALHAEGRPVQQPEPFHHTVVQPYVGDLDAAEEPLRGPIEGASTAKPCLCAVTSTSRGRRRIGVLSSDGTVLIVITVGAVLLCRRGSEGIQR